MTIKNLYPPAIIIILVLGINFNTLFNDFVYDDNFEVLQNHWIKDIKYVPEIFSSSSWEFIGRGSNYYRPLIHLVRMVNYHIFGLKPWGFHLVNIMFHAGISVFVFLIARKLLGGDEKSFFSPSFAAAALFATHPVHTEEVAWASSIAGLTFTLLDLLSFYLYMTSTADGRIRSRVNYYLSAAVFFLAALSKELALTLPVVIVLYEYLFNRSRPLTCLKRCMPYLAAAGVYFILRWRVLGGVVPAKGHNELSGFMYFLNAFPLFAAYLNKLVIPLDLNAYYVFHPVMSIFEPRAVISIAVTLAYVLFSYISLKKNKTAFFAFSFIVITLLPALYIPALGTNVFAERYLYLPSFGFVILVSLLVAWIRKDKPEWAIAATICFFILAGLYSIGTISRNGVWKNDYSLWEDTVKKSPDGSEPHNSFGWACYKRGLIEEAIEHFYIALEINPAHAEAHNNLGVVYGTGRLTEEAIEHFQAAIALNPDFADAHNNLGIAFGKKRRFNEAIRHFQAAVKLKPGAADIHDNLAVTYMNAGLIDKAIEHFQAALELSPDNTSIHLKIARAYELIGMVKKAEEHRLKAGKALKNLVK